VVKFDGGSNFYVYSGNDPVNYIDPNGEIAIMALLAAGYAIFEVGMTIYDIVDTILTLVDPCESNTMKGITVGGVLIGMVLPGGGYGKAGKEGAEQAYKLARKIDWDSIIKFKYKGLDKLGGREKKIAETMIDNFQQKFLAGTGDKLKDIRNVRNLKKGKLWEIKHKDGVRVYLDEAGSVIGYGNKNSQQKDINRLMNLLGLE